MLAGLNSPLHNGQMQDAPRSPRTPAGLLGWHSQAGSAASGAHTCHQILRSAYACGRNQKRTVGEYMAATACGTVGRKPERAAKYWFALDVAAGVAGKGPAQAEALNHLAVGPRGPAACSVGSSAHHNGKPTH